MNDEVAEWLRRWTANPMCSARVGSNPILVDMFLTKLAAKTLVTHEKDPCYVQRARCLINLDHRLEESHCQSTVYTFEKISFRHRESNPGLLGESQLS